MSEIRKELDGTKGRYVLDTEAGEAEMTFSVLSPSTIIVDHTGVPKAVEGQGHAAALAEFAVADARANGHRIVPLCPFLNRWRARHPDTADAFNV